MSTQPYKGNEPEKLRGVSINILPLLSRKFWSDVRLWIARKWYRFKYVPKD